MLEEKHNIKAWIYLSPALVLLLVFTFYPIFNAFNLLFMYNYDYMQGERDGYTFYHHDPVRAEQWAYREHWDTVTGLAVSDDGFVYSSSNGLSLQRTTLRGVISGQYLSTDPGKVQLVFDIDASTPYTTDDVTAFYVDGVSNVYIAVYDDDQDVHLVLRLGLQPDHTWQLIDTINTTHTDPITQVIASSPNHIYTGTEGGTIIKLDNAGDIAWTNTEHTDAINDFDLAGNFLYTASEDQNVAKIAVSDGDTIWMYQHTDSVTAVSVDIRDNVYSASLDGTLISVDVDSDVRFTYNHDDAFVHAAVDRNRQLHAVSQDGLLHKLYEDGTLLRTVEIGNDNVDQFIVDTSTRSNVYVAFDDGRVEKYDTDGLKVWTYMRHETALFGMALDNRDRLFTASYEGMIYRVDQLVVFTNFESPIVSVATDIENNVYVGLENNMVYKINNDAEVVWAYADADAPITSLSVDDNLNVYAGLENGMLHKIDLNGIQYWTSNAHTSAILDVEIDNELNVFTASEDNTLRKIDSDGQAIWTYTEHTGNVNGIAVGDDGFVYTASSDNTVHKIDADGTNVWIYEGHTAAVNDVVVDREGRIYTVSDDETFKRLTANGSEFWTYTWFSRSDDNTIRIQTLALDSEDNIYFSTAGDGSVLPSIRRINEATRISIFHNFINTVQSDMFVRALINTIFIVFVSVPVSVIISLLLSVWLNSIKKLQGVFQTIFFLPYVTNAIAIGMAFAVIFNRDYGLINYLLTEVFGMAEGLNWLGRVSVDEDASGIRRFLMQYLNLPMLSLMVFITWGGLAFKIMVFLSGLQSIDKQYYDAARVDSTPRSRVFRRITIPLLSPMIAYITITSFIGAFKEYTAIVGMFGVTLGPPGDPDRLITIVGLVYKSLNEMGVPGRLSEAAATAIILFFMTLALTLFNMYVSKKRVHY